MQRSVTVLAMGAIVGLAAVPSSAQQIAGGTWSSQPGDACAAFADKATDVSSCDDGNFYDGKTYKMQGGLYTKVYLNTGRIIFIPQDGGAETNSADPGGNKR